LARRARKDVLRAKRETGPDAARVGAARAEKEKEKEKKKRAVETGDGTAAVDEIGRATRFFIFETFAGERSGRPAVQGVLLRGRLREAVRLG
jgi:hypothetical protein